MDNPVLLLVERLKEWQTSNGGVPLFEQRGGRDGWWEAHVEAVTWLREAESFAAGPAIDGAASRALESARRAIVGTRHPYFAHAGGQTVKHIEPHDLDNLRLLGAMWANRSVSVSVDSLVGMYDVAGDLMRLLMDAPDLDTQTRRYLLDLISHLQKAIAAVGTIGPEEIRRLANELVGALTLYTEHGGMDQDGKGKAALQRLKEYLLKLFTSTTAKAVERAVSEGLNELLPPPGQ